MTDRRRKRRRHPARTARFVVGGLSAAGTFALVAAYPLQANAGATTSQASDPQVDDAAAAPEPEVGLADQEAEVEATTVPRRKIVVHIKRPSATLPAPTVAGTAPAATVAPAAPVAPAPAPAKQATTKKPATKKPATKKTTKAKPAKVAAQPVTKSSGS